VPPFPRDPSSRSPRLSWLCRWQIVLDAGLMLTALVLAGFVTRRAWLLVVLVPACFVPFSFARLHMQRLLESALPGGRGRGAFLDGLAVLGGALDLVMVGQLVTARSHAWAAFLHEPVVSWVGPVWFSAHALLAMGLLIVALLRPVVRVFAWLGRATAGRDAAPVETSPDRRAFLRQASVLGVGAPFLISLSGVRLSYDFRVEERELVLPGWPKELDGLRVAHLSDIHVGGTMDRHRLLQVAELTDRARPDLVLHTGDFLTHHSGEFDGPLYEALGRIRAPYGQWACLGNHDLGDAPRLVRRLGDTGVVTLRDRATTIDVAGHPLEIAGVDFRFAGMGRGAVYARVVSSLPRAGGVPRLLLNHDPSTFAALPEGSADLVLSGHTHGGHVGVQLDADHALTVVRLIGIPDQGLFERGDMRLFVTRCVGFYGYPMRLGIPPEIAILTLRARSA
jgi:predicted MPP superfamily phosphohydrolase